MTMMERDKVQDRSLLVGRYEVIRELGRGAQGRTLLARDRDHFGGEVALKELHFGRIKKIKVLELFEREARVLSQISHDAIPTYYEHFFVEGRDGEGARYYLVQEYVEGESLGDLIKGGRLFQEAEVRRFIEEVLDILVYLHGHSPPIIHRDIKPSNIMVRRSDDAFVLVDFGAVQQQVLSTMGSSTIVGTSGYMPPEQLMGRTIPSSDLYALGATAIYMLSHISPLEMQEDAMTLDFRPYVNISEPFTRFLERLCAPYVEDRFESSVEALRALQEPSILLAPSVQEGVQRLEGQSLEGELFFSWPEEQKDQVLKGFDQHQGPDADKRRFVIAMAGVKPTQVRAEVHDDGLEMAIIFPRKWGLMTQKAAKPILLGLFWSAFAIIIAYLFIEHEIQGAPKYRTAKDITEAILGAGFVFVASLMSIYFQLLEVLNIFTRPRLSATKEKVVYEPFNGESREVSARAIERYALIYREGRRGRVGRYMMELFSSEEGTIVMDEDISLEEQRYLMGELRSFIKR